MREVAAETVERWLQDGDEFAPLDAREHGQYGESHPLRAVWMPYPTLETRAPALVPRLATRTVALDAGDSIAARGRPDAPGYDRMHVLRAGEPASSVRGALRATARDGGTR